MNRQLEAVKEFHETFNHPINEDYNNIALKVRQLRVKLIFEELQELAEALDVKGTFNDLCLQNIKVETDGDNVDDKEVLDACTDIQYVLSGGIIALGHYNKFDEAFEEVHSSNMSKMCNTQQELDDSLNFYKDKNIDVYSVQKGDGWIVLRTEDNKILKNFHYQEAKLDKFL